MSKPKLPKVWVMFNTGGGAFVSASTPPSIGQPIGVKHLYAPVQKPKVCVWTEDEEYWRIGCDKTTDGPYQIEAHTYCPFCGGKIRRAK